MYFYTLVTICQYFGYHLSDMYAMYFADVSVDAVQHLKIKSICIPECTCKCWVNLKYVRITQCAMWLYCLY